MQNMQMSVMIALITTIGLLSMSHSISAQDIFLRYNQLGYHPDEKPTIMVLSTGMLSGPLDVIQIDNGNKIREALWQPLEDGLWGQFPYQYLLQLPANLDEGKYVVRFEEKNLAHIDIGHAIYDPYREDLLAFMRQQRCGYNPYFEDVCHQSDGRIYYAPVPDSTYYDFTGGWHDAGDQLKYLITGSNATARMLMAYTFSPEKFADQTDALGHEIPNGIPDILDEAKWGLDWILKLHPRTDWLIHQIADDRDHRGFKIPAKDNADYGWGPNSYRAAYFANGAPQGLGQWKSMATGIANLAGRCAAALAMASTIWESIDPYFAIQCKDASIEIYQMGKQQEGYQQGNSFGAPYRYNEDSWADDMEWGAAELYKITGENHYLQDAVHYAEMIKEDGWMARDTMNHYQKYPFMNMGHYALYSIASKEVQLKLAGWYRKNIEKIAARASKNAYEIGVVFLWCSNNLTVNFITQVILYEKMTGDLRYHELMEKHRDWLFGRNPWGTSMFTGIPVGGEFPEDVHLPATVLLRHTPAGGLIDGPIYMSTFQNLFGLELQDPDEFARFQNAYITYHDDIGDFSTNEPTMDGTADAILMWSLLE